MAGTTADDDQPSETARLFQTAVRESITPYLPPPVIKAMREIDPRLEPLVGPEASVTIFGSLLLAWFLLRLLLSSKTVFSSGSSSLGSGSKNTAIQEDDRDKDILPSDAETSRPFDGTVLLCGPSLGGKTSLFYRLLQPCDSSSNPSSTGTVRSIKSNTGFLDTSPNAEAGTGSSVLRILDTPGHWGPQKLLRAIPLQEVLRLVVVVDSTQPVAPAADYLYAVLKSTIPDNGPNTSVLIACHKSDHAKAKNARRIKLQLRSELVRLSKLECGDGDSNDWEEILNSVPLCSSSISDLKVVRQFCETGMVPSESKKR
eukprot:jgi/Psemu1/199690/e_gw1.244.57.1